MSARTSMCYRTLTVLLVLLLVAGACGEGAAGVRQLTGVVVDVDASNITDVKRFTLRSEDQTEEIFIDPELEYEFPPSHLSEHLMSGEPVAVEVEDRDGRLYALSLRDA